MQIEGIPDGWELVRVGKCKFGEFYVAHNGEPCEWTYSDGSGYANYVIIRKKAKRYRHFANAAEYMPNWGKPVDWKKNDISPCNCAVVCVNSVYLWVAFGDAIRRFSWEEAFGKIWFADGTPFGVEVIE